MKKFALCLICYLFTFVFAGIIKGQDDVHLNIQDVHSTSGGKIELLFSVLNEEGIPIKDLSYANFKLVVGNEEIKKFSLESISNDKSSLSIILGIDVSASMEGVPITEAKKAASLFLRQLSEKDYTALMVFGNDVRFLADFTQMKNEVREKVMSINVSDMWTRLYQATYDSLSKASKSPTPRSVIVILTDGKDEGSIKNEEDIVNKIQETQIPIFAISFGEKANKEYLKIIAGISGGYFLFTPKAEEISRLYGLVLEQLKNQYLIRFDFTDHSANDYTGILTLNYHGKEFIAQKVFSPISAEREGKRISYLKILGMIIPGVSAIGIAIYVILIRNKKIIKSDEKIPEVAVMIQRKIHPVNSFFSDFSNTPMNTTVFLPSKGEVGLEINMPSMPCFFPLIDKVNKRTFEEVVITRYDKDKDYLFSKKKVYILISNTSVSRPDDDREGHARVFLNKDTDTYHIEDLGSSAGTQLNESGLNKNEPVALRNDDRITMGTVGLKYFEKTTSSSETSF